MSIKNFSIISMALWVLVACNEDIELLKDPVDKLSNDCIKRTLPYSPNIVGEQIEFAYAIALPKDMGVLKSVKVEATIPGSGLTYIDPNSYYTNNSGIDIPVKVAGASKNEGNVTNIEFEVDTCAATLRYYYEIPMEAKGKEVSFVFSAESSDGQTVQYSKGPYKISNMDMVKNIPIDNNSCYISFTNENALDVYTKDELDSNPSLVNKVDLVYHYFSEYSDFSHSFFTKNSPVEYLEGVYIPEGMKSTKMIKVYGLNDRQLSDLQYNQFVDDLDLQEINMASASTYLLGLKTESGVWIENEDATIRAYIYVNKISSGGMEISIKRLIL